MLRFQVLGASFSSFECFVFKFWVLRLRDFGVFVVEIGCFVFEIGRFVFEFLVLRFRDLGASFSRFGCFVLRSSFLSASFSKVPRHDCNNLIYRVPGIRRRKPSNLLLYRKSCEV